YGPAVCGRRSSHGARRFLDTRGGPDDRHPDSDRAAPDLRPDWPDGLADRSADTCDLYDWLLVHQSGHARQDGAGPENHLRGWQASNGEQGNGSLPWPDDFHVAAAHWPYHGRLRR